MKNNNNVINKRNVKKFWAWFAMNCEKFGGEYDNGNLIAELDSWIVKLGNYSWEIGPGELKKNSLVISPNGDLNMLKKTKEIVSEAVECQDWEFHYAKPRKNWNMLFEFESNSGIIITIDAKLWQYVLLKYKDGTFEIMVAENGLKSSLDDEDKLMVCEIVLDGILGEELRIKKISEINIVSEFDVKYDSKKSYMTDLWSHIIKII